MSRWISTHDELIPLYTELTDYVPHLPDPRVIFEFEDGIPIAAAAYDDYTVVSINFHIWIAKGRRPSRVWWWAVHDYPFNQLGVKQGFGMARETNRNVIRAAETGGWELIARLPDHYRDGDTLIFRLTPETAKHWQRYRSGATPPPTYGKRYDLVRT
jgi:hypothetical protein